VVRGPRGSGCAERHFLLCAVDASRPIGAGISVALLFVTRPPMLVVGIFFVLVVWRQTWHADTRTLDWSTALRKLAPFTVPIVIVVAVTLLYNRARFGGFEFGHEHLNVGWKARIEKWGLFSYHYLARNLAIVTSSLPYWTPAPPHIQINSHGLALWVTTPLYLWLLCRAERHFSGARFLVSTLPIILAVLLYQNSGWLNSAIASPTTSPSSFSRSSPWPAIASDRFFTRARCGPSPSTRSAR